MPDVRMDRHGNVVKVVAQRSGRKARRRWLAREVDRYRAGLLSDEGLAEALLSELGWKYDPSQPREPAGGPGGGRWTSAGTSSSYGDNADNFNQAPIDIQSKARKWREANQEQYNENDEFKILADTIALYTQGNYNSIRVFSEYVVTGKVPKEYQDSRFPVWIKDNFAMSAMSSPLADNKTYFEGQDLSGNGLGDVSSLEAAAILQRSIADSAPLNRSLYRGVTAQKIRVPGVPDKTGWAVDTYKDPPVPKIGETFDILGTSSFTADEGAATKFASGQMRGQTRSHKEGASNAPYLAVYEILPGAHGINASPLSPWNQKEIITSGRFEVVNVELWKTGVFRTGFRHGEVPGYRVTLKQIGVWDVDVDKFKGKPVKKTYASP